MKWMLILTLMNFDIPPPWIPGLVIEDNGTGNYTVIHDKHFDDLIECLDEGLRISEEHPGVMPTCLET